jgi:hypothetical protein
MYAMVVFQYNNVLNSSKENSLRRLTRAIMTDTCNREHNGNKTGTLISTVDTQVLVSPVENPCTPNGAIVKVLTKYSQNAHEDT